MRDRIDFDALPYAIGAILLGIVTLLARDLAPPWYRMPTGGPAQAPIVMVSGLILIVGGLIALWRNAGHARLILPLFYLFWVEVLDLPRFAGKPSVATLLPASEILSLVAAGTTLWLSGSRPQWLKPSARVLFGLCAIVFGLSHLIYAQSASTFVPAWLPAPLFWIYFTGTAHIAAGLAILSGVLARLAASMEAFMCASFELLIQVPKVVAAPYDHKQWTNVAVTLSIAGGARLVRRLVGAKVVENRDTTEPAPSAA